MALSNTFVFNVKRREPQMIVPKHPKPHEIKQLSDMDVQDGLRILIPIVVFYGPAGAVHKSSGSDPVEKIREGLAKALSFYYPLAGRIFEGPDGKLMVNCNNEGVLFVEADANVKVEQLGDEILPPCPHIEKFLCSVQPSGPGEMREMTIGRPLLFIQVTRFICGGFALGIQFNHTMTDAYGLMLFLYVLRELIEKDGARAPSIPHVWQRELLNARFPPRITCTHNEFDFASHNKPSLTPITKDYLENSILTSIFFGPKEIQALRDRLPLQNHSVSRSELITACLWKCRTIALAPPPTEAVSLSYVLSVRDKKKLGLPIAYYGNAFVHPTAVSEAQTLCTSPLTYAVELIQKAKAQVNEEYVRSVVDSIKKGHKYVMTKWNYFITDMTSLRLDKLDLGWGKPLYGGNPLATFNYSGFSIAKNDKGEDIVAVPICLPPLAVEKFQNALRKMTSQPNSKL